MNEKEVTPTPWKTITYPKAGGGTLTDIVAPALSDDYVVSDMQNPVDGEHIVHCVNGHDGLVAALELPLLFHAGGPWSDEKTTRWEEITGKDEATTKVMCDHIRAIVAKAKGEER